MNISQTYYGINDAIKELENNKHSLIISSDVYKKDKNNSKIFMTIKNHKELIKKINSEKNPNYYEVVHSNKCQMYADIEWNSSEYLYPDDNVLDKVKEFIKIVLKKIGVDENIDTHVFSSCKENKKSYHMIVTNYHFANNEDQTRFWNEVYKLYINYDELSYINETDSNYIIKYPIDFGVYNKTQQYRSPKCFKMNQHGEYVRPLLNIDGDDFICEDMFITYIPSNSVELKVDNLDHMIVMRKRNNYSKKVVNEILKKNNCDVDIKDIKNNMFVLRNNGNRKCIINGEINESDNCYCFFKNNALFFGCHDEHCKGNSKQIFKFKDTIDSENSIKDNFDIFLNILIRIDMNEKINDEKKELLKKKTYDDIIIYMNKYFKYITGTTKPYVLYYDNNTWNRKIDSELGKVFVHEYEKKKFVYRWLISTKREQYYAEECNFECVGINTNPNIFNTFLGLDISYADSIEKRSENYKENVLSSIGIHIKDNWANGDDKIYNYILSLFAHIIQKPHERTLVNLVIRGEQGTGKGIVLNKFKDIIGEKYFFHPTSIDHVLGKFTSLMDDKLLIFLDEMMWGGDHEGANKLKKLITEETRISEEKFCAPRVVKQNAQFITASNNENPISVEAKDRRSFVINTQNGLLSDKGKILAKNISDLSPYDFASFLYEYDISNFDPKKIICTDVLNELKTFNMTNVHKFWLDLITEHKRKEIDSGLPSDKFGSNIKKQQITSLWKEFAKENKVYKPNDKSFWSQSRNIFPDIPVKDNWYMPSVDNSIILFNKYFNANSEKSMFEF